MRRTAALVVLAVVLWVPAASPRLAQPVAAAAGAATAATAATAPVPGALVAPFDPPADPYGPGRRGVHLAADPGAAVRAPLPGVVAFAGPVAGHGWVTLDHGAGLRTTYGWLDPIHVAAGQAVAARQILGRLDHGRALLHWGARVDGHYVDPMLLLAPWRIRLVADR